MQLTPSHRRMFSHRASSGDRRGPLKYDDLAAYLEQRMSAGCASYASTYNNDSHGGANCTRLSLPRNQSNWPSFDYLEEDKGHT